MALSSSDARSAGASASGTTSANGSIVPGIVAVSLAATLVGDVASQGCGSCTGKIIAVSITMAARFARHRLFHRRGHPAHNLIGHTPGTWRVMLG
jgi:hypothetical protein